MEIVFTELLLFGEMTKTNDEKHEEISLFQKIQWLLSCHPKLFSTTNTATAISTLNSYTVMSSADLTVSDIAIILMVQYR